VFPLIAREGGVLMRSGHTEAAIDLCRLAGLPPVGVLAELVNDDGTVKHGAEVARFAEDHGLRQISVAEIIAWRQRSEKLVERVADSQVVTRAGPARALAYVTPFDATQHLAIVFGSIAEGRSTLVRIHREAVVEDVFGPLDGLDALMKRMAAGGGVIVYLREGAVGVAEGGGSQRDAVMTGSSVASAAQRREEWREVGLGAQILRDLGVRSIRLIASRERRYVGLNAFGITIEATETP
jgi:3,4-dihydroxy 2-butanone 4-phosphate synthase/GTP cyclohydrolase II